MYITKRKEKQTLVFIVFSFYPIPRQSHTLAAIPAKVAVSAPANVQFIFVTGKCFSSPVAIKYTEIV